MIVETIVSRHGQQTNNLYSRGRFLRESQNARQYEVQELTTSEVMTAKIISKAFINKNKTRQKLLAEIKNHRKFAHSNILKFKHVFEDQENVYLLVERIPNGNLEELLGRRVRLS
jgi:serine/threonine protein kinase